MSILAHLSDLHLIERDHHKRRGLARQRLVFLSTGAPLDALGRMQRVATTLQRALRSGADHVLITGDLTEDGTPAQFEVLAEVLHDSGWSPECVTLVPGNHDDYAQTGAFARALEGPLRAFAKTSTNRAPIELAEALIVPISTVLEGQLFTHSRGVVRSEDVLAVRKLASDPISKQRAVVVAQHHPPSHHALFAWEWFDGVKNALELRDLVLERTRVHVLHGHAHRRSTKHFSGRSHAQVFCAASVRDGDREGLPLRVYEAEAGALRELASNVAVCQPLPAAHAAPSFAFAGAMG